MSERRKSSAAPAKDQTRLRIEKMEAEREERRKAMQARKKNRAQEEQRNIAAGNPGDVDFIGMVRRWREEHKKDIRPHSTAEDHPRICIGVRKRPISDKERNKNDHDSVSCLNPVVWIHSAKIRVDGISKYLDHNSFQFDHAFDELATTDEVYKCTTMPLLDFVCAGTGGRATVFAYGQTGSGKTHTMNGIQQCVCEDLFLLLSEGGIEGGCTLNDTTIMISFFEMYGGFVQDLLNDRKRLKVLEDGKGEIQVTGLEETEIMDQEKFHEIVEAGNSARTTHTTEANDTSSRSHAICQIVLRDKKSGKLRGKLSLVDLAGSERGTDTKAHNAQRRAESSDINTSLLALKECVRALGVNKKGPKHVPYRASKLTLILKDCFTSPDAMTTMIATVSPGASAADHSLNTLRYGDRIKEQRVGTNTQGPKTTPPRRKLSTQSSSSITDPPKPSNLDPPNVKTASRSSNNSAEAKMEPKDPPKALNINRPKVKTGSHSSVDSAEAMMEDSSVSETVEVNASSRDASKNAEDESGDLAHGGDEDELRRTVQALFEQEEAMLNLHMSNIQENAELLTIEGKLLHDVQGEKSTDDDIDHYVSSLEKVLDQKENMILALQEKLEVFQEHLRKEKELSTKVGTLAQY